MKAKSAPHLELYVIPLFLERAVAAKRTRIRSAPQNAVLSRAAQGSQTQGFQNHIPARGRKRLVSGHKTTGICLFQNHIPARGRKPHRRAHHPADQEVHFKTTSPQGDGNRQLLTIVSRSSYFKTTSPQGDGNFKMIRIPCDQTLFQNHIPARGRHTQGALAPYFFMLF